MKKNKKNNNNVVAIHTKKLKLFGAFTTVAFVVLFARVVYIKVAKGTAYERAVVEQEYSIRNSESVLKADRGNIFDRNRTPLAMSYGVETVFLDLRTIVEERDNALKSGNTKKIEAMRALPATVGEALGFSATQIQELQALFPPENGNYKLEDFTKHKVIATNVEKAKTKPLTDKKLVGVHTEPATQRKYPNDTLFAPVVGFLRGEASWGLESAYNTDLKGEDGVVVRSKDAVGGTTFKTEPVQGYSLITTLDAQIQRMAEDAVARSDASFPAEKTIALVTNPKTGEVLAMAQYPPFSLNDPTNIEALTAVDKATGATNTRFTDKLAQLPKEEQLKQLDSVWQNFSITSSFEPGSIYKPVVVAAALEAGAIDEHQTFFCGGTDPVTGLPCHYKPGHGTQTIEQALANSCNVAMIEIARKMGRDSYFNAHKSFGFGEKTGIDLSAEQSFAALQYTLEQLKHPLNIGTSSFGQGFTATPLQSINSFGAIINGGTLMKPYVVAQVLDANGNVVKENKPTVLNQVISKKTSDYMRKAMVRVLSPQGTGRKAQIPGYAIGGKTGTAQQGTRKEGKWTLSFASYLPAENPEIMILVAIHKPENYTDGVTTPAPLMKELMEKIIEYKGYLPTETTQDGANNTPIEKNSFQIESFEGLSVVEATQKLANRGIAYSIIGDGNVVRGQMPLPESYMTQTDKVYLYLATDEKVSAPEELAIIPDVRNVSLEKGKQILEEAGFVVRVEGADEEGKIINPTDTIATQMPPGGGKIQKGIAITIGVKAEQNTNE